MILLLAEAVHDNSLGRSGSDSYISLRIEWSRVNEAYFKLIHTGLGRNGGIEAGVLVFAIGPDHRACRVPTLSPPSSKPMTAGINHMNK